MNGGTDNDRKAEQQRPGLWLLPSKAQELELTSLAKPPLNLPHKFKDWILPVLLAFLFAVTNT